LVELILATPIRVGDAASWTTLRDAAPALSRYFLERTTSGPLPTDLVVAGQPVVAIETDIDLPVRRTTHLLLRRTIGDVEVSSFDASGVNSWVVRSATAHRPVRREVRTHITNLHADRETLRALLKLVKNGTLPSPTSQQGQQVLSDALERLLRYLGRRRKSEKAVQLREAFDSVLSLFESDRELSVILTKLECLAPQLRDQLEQSIRRSEKAFLVREAANSGMEVLMTGDVHTTVYGNVTNSVVGSFNSLRDSLNDARSGDATSPELLRRLEELEAAGKAAAKELADSGLTEDARTLAEDLSSLAKEALKKVPRTGHLETIASGIRAVAEKASQFGPAVAAVVAGVLSLF
jgi:hypothetical protein